MMVGWGLDSHRWLPHSKSVRNGAAVAPLWGLIHSILASSPAKLSLYSRPTIGDIQSPFFIFSITPMSQATFPLSQDVDQLLQRLGVPPAAYQGGSLSVSSPITGEVIAALTPTTPEQASDKIARAQAAFLAWRKVPAPRRGELVRLLGEELRAAKAELGLLVTLEVGKVPSEGAGEVQEMIDICDFAVGLSRQLYGKTIATERPEHRMMETWHPLGVCGVISAFNFPVAVWCWNAALALVCGDSVVWKPSEKTPLTALATLAIAQRALDRFGDAPEGLLELLIGERAIGELLVDDTRIKVLSATGSTAMGRAVAPRLAGRFARAILELGGNNAAIVAPSADLNLALRGIAFAAMGTAGQRCTTLRRLFVHESVYEALVPQLIQVYAKVAVGDPRTPGTLVGPLIDRAAFDGMEKALAESRALGATVHGGERVDEIAAADAFYVRPALVELKDHAGPVLRETFAPILYVMRYSTLEQVIDWHNAVGAGLSSSIFTLNMREAEQFLASSGSDCGIANVNIGPSGAEIGGAFGGEKETGGGRESGSDAWKAYMRRATNTINYSTALPLAQGVSFEIGD
jgi:aldehyde dehydrogenase (NAD+)